MQALLAFLRGEHMDDFTILPLFLVATFAGAFVAGLSGFAFGLVAASLWLYIIAPLQSAILIVAFGLIVQGYSVWRLRHALDWHKLWPFVVGAAFGVPAGVALVAWLDPRSARISVGVLLVHYSLYAFFRPSLQSVAAEGPVVDAAVGYLNGVLGGLTGLAGILVTIWCGLRGWSKDVQRIRFPARGCRDIPYECALAWREGSGHQWNDLAILRGTAVPHSGYLAGPKALWAN